MSKDTICVGCHTTFTPGRRNWAGPDEDLPVCDVCLQEDASYENQAQPVNPWRPVSELPNMLSGKKVGQ